MINKSTKKRTTVWHRQLGKAEFMGWFDHEAQDYAIVKIPGMQSMITLPCKELSDRPIKIKDIKPDWYATSMETVHFWVPDGFDGYYRSACGKAKAAGGELMPELDPSGAQGPDPERRCRRCLLSARKAVKTTLFDFGKEK